MAMQDRLGWRVVAPLFLWAVLLFASGGARAEPVTFDYSGQYGGGTGDLATALFSGTLTYDPSNPPIDLAATLEINGTGVPIKFAQLGYRQIHLDFDDYQGNYGDLYFMGIGPALPVQQPPDGSVTITFDGSFNDEVNGQNTGNTNGGNDLQYVSYTLVGPSTLGVGVPEPSSLAIALAALGVAGIGRRAVRRRLPG